MRKIITFILCLVLFLGSCITASAYVSVDGYFRSDGTYVRPHVRSEPNGIRYDNYGWTPSQGLYNDSYFDSGYSSDWYSPSWSTDPYYYEGLDIYNSGGFSGSSYYSTPSCPINSTYSYLEESCMCNSGYVAQGSSCITANTYCKNEYGWSAYYNYLTDSCGCNDGYSFSNGQCTSNDSICKDMFGYGSTSTEGTLCACSGGYMWNDSMTRCILDTSWSNSYSTTQYEDVCGVNSHSTGNGTCVCDVGYIWKSDDSNDLDCELALDVVLNSAVKSTADCKVFYGGGARYNTGGVAGCICQAGTHEWNDRRDTCEAM